MSDLRDDLRRIATESPDQADRQRAKQMLAARFGDEALAEVQPGPWKQGPEPMDLLGVEMERAQRQRQKSKLAKGREEEAALRTKADAAPTGFLDALTSADTYKAPGFVSDAVEAGGALAMDWADTLTFGGASAVMGLHPGQRQRIQQQRRTVDEAGDIGQLARGTSKGIGYATPTGAPQVATAAGRELFNMVKDVPRNAMTKALAPVATAAGVQAGGEASTRAATGEITPGEAFEETVAGTTMGLGVGAGAHAVGRAAGAVSDRIRNSKGTTGEDIRLLERHGASPSPVPGRPVANAPSEQLGMPATSETRGQVGTDIATRMQNELGKQKQALNRRFPAEMGPAMESQGGRIVSVEGLREEVVRKLSTPEATVNKEMRGKLQGVLDYLDGKTEDFTTAHVARVPGVNDVAETGGSLRGTPGSVEPMVRRRGRTVGGQGVGERATVGGGEEMLERPETTYLTRPEEVTTSRAAVFSKTPEGEFVPRARRVGNAAGSNTATGRAVSVDVEPITIDRLDIAPTTSRSANVESTPIDVMMTDVRRRVGDAPNKVRTIEELNALRDHLDDLADVEVAATGGKMDKKKVPLAQVGSAIRDDIVAREAPRVAHVNRRHHDAKKKLELTEERMRTDNDESLGMQIASLGEEGSKVSGARKRRLEELKLQFPTSEFLTLDEIRRGFDVPRLLLAEERMALKNIPRIGSGGSNVTNIAEPILGRGVYPAAGAVEDTLSGVAGGAHLSFDERLLPPLHMQQPGRQRRALPPLTLPAMTLLDVEEERIRRKKAQKKERP